MLFFANRNTKYFIVFFRVIKLLRNSASQVTITVATQVAQLFGLNEVLQTSPQISRKAVKVPVPHEYG